MLATQLFGPIKQWGFLVKGVGPWWGYRNVTLEAHIKGQVNEVTMDVGLAYQNGVQIELIHQTNSVLSPYSEFYSSDKQQFMYQVAYFAPDIDAAIATAKQAGISEQGFCKTMLDQRYVYMGHPMMGDVVVELMEVDDSFIADYERCAQQAETWDGSDPYRLNSL